jgi:tripartite-type tricarboxylate transporter receptor subunit TctC
MGRSRLIWLLVCLCVLFFIPELASAGASYPSRPITIIVPSTAGGGTDLAARVLASMLDKEIGVPVQVVDKPGAGHQVGITELAKAKPDGYTLGYVVLPTAFNTYLDPARKAIYNRDSFVPLATQYDLGYVIGVHKDSPYKSLQDLVVAARATPNAIKLGTTGLMASGHLSALKFEKAAGVKFALVHFDGTPPQVNALAGKHVDTIFTGQVELLPHFKAGTMRALAVLERGGNADFPGVETAGAQGYPVYHSVIGVICGPKGLSPEIVEVLGGAMRKIIGSADHNSKMKQLGFPVKYLGPTEAASFWADTEAEVRPFMEESFKAK